MRIFRTALHNHLVEVRYDYFGNKIVLLNGQPVARGYFFSALTANLFTFAITDEQGQRRHVEVRFDIPGNWSLGRRARIIIDGVDRAFLSPEPHKAALTLCANCGYDLKGLEVHNAEIKCPECGRHSLAATLGAQ